ncbi:MAG: TolC family protein [Gemmatimonadaceae bacterium]
MLQVVLLPLLLQVSASTDSLSLTEALARARTSRAEAIGISARVEERRAERRLSGRPSNPTVEYSTVAADETRRLSVTQPLGSLPRLGLERASADAQVAAARADSAQRMANLERDVARAYFAAAAAERRVRLLEDLVRLADSLGALAVRRATLGDISDLDRLQLTLEATRARLQLSRALEVRTTRRADLARELAWESPLPPVPSTSLSDGLSDAILAPSFAVEEVPEVQRARAASDAARLSARSLRWARLPVPGVLLQREWSRVPGVPTLTRLGLSVPLPLFSLGNEAMDASVARARLAEAQATEAELEATRALAVARARTEESARRARLASDSLVVGVVQLREGAVRLYDAGRTSVLQVLEALRAERDAQLLAVDELLAFQEARADLAAVAGRSPTFPNR